MDPAKNFWGGYAVPWDKIFVPRPAITIFLSKFRVKRGLKLLNWAKTELKNWAKTAQEARRRRFFWKITYFQAIFGASWGVITPLGRTWGGVATPPVDPSLQYFNNHKFSYINNHNIVWVFYAHVS